MYFFRFYLAEFYKGICPVVSENIFFISLAACYVNFYVVKLSD